MKPGAAKIIDISRTISPDADVYPGDPPIEMKKLYELGVNAACNVTLLTCATHAGTHVDPPIHFLARGKTLDEMPLDRFMGEALVIDVDQKSVTPRHLPAEDLRGRCLLFKTAGAGSGFVSEEAAHEMAARGVTLVGIDSFSVDARGREDHPSHLILLQSEIVILEGLDLSYAPAGRYTLIALPLKIARGDGSPVRAVLISES